MAVAQEMAGTRASFAVLVFGLLLPIGTILSHFGELCWWIVLCKKCISEPWNTDSLGYCDWSEKHAQKDWEWASASHDTIVSVSGTANNTFVICNVRYGLK